MSIIKKSLIAAALATVVGVVGFAGVANARWGDRDDYYRYHDHDHDHDHYYYRAPPPVYYTPAPRYYYPPPVVYSPGFSIYTPGIGINIR